jgi:signal transduction histidine kinase
MIVTEPALDDAHLCRIPAVMRRRATGVALLLVLWHLAVATPTASALVDSSGIATGPPPVRNVLLIHAVPRTTPALLTIEQTFTSTLRAIAPDQLAFHSEYIDLATVDQRSTFEAELVAYLAAKYGRMKLDLVVVTTSEALRFTMRHRSRLFPRVPAVFVAVVKRLVADVPLDPDVSGVWVSIAWSATLEAARRLQPDIERAVVVAGAAPIDRLSMTEARAQLGHGYQSIAITFLEGLPIETVLARVAALPPRSVVLLGSFARDPTGRRFMPAESTALLSSASRVPVYGTSETQLGYGAVGGRVISFERQGRGAAEIAARMLRGERPPPVEGETLAYRFDARQLRRFGLDARRLPAGSQLEFEPPSLWEAYRTYVVVGGVVLALQTWTIIGLLVNRTRRRRAEEEVAGQLRFETLTSDILAGQLTAPAGDFDREIQRALRLIAEHLDVDRIILSERDVPQRRAQVVQAWTRENIPEMPRSILWSLYPWLARRVGEGHVVAISPRRPFPPEAVTDRETMVAYGVRSLLAVPLVVERKLVGVLSCATLRSGREWPDAVIDRLQLVANVFASTLARRRAEAAARESEERFEQQRQELAHTLRVSTLGALGASLAHEINQPLAAILLNARALAASLHRDPAAESAAAETLGDIAADARRASEIIDRLRALSRKEHVWQRHLNLDALVDEVAGLLRLHCVRRDIVVKRVAGPGLATVTGDRIQLQQIVLNLLMNACEALETVDPGRREITIVTGRPAPGVVEVAIRDTGVGDKELDVERMFESFVTTKPGGLGMGLAISRSIATAHGGRLYARANAGGGLTVHLELPAES